MCMFCAAVPAAAALGAKMNADQLQKPVEQRQPIAKLTGLGIALLVTASIVYHSLTWRS